MSRILLLELFFFIFSLTCLVVTESSSSTENRPVSTATSSSTRMANKGDQINNNNYLPKDDDRLRIRLFIVRHGETESNDEFIVIGQTDSPLSARGRAQARALAQSDWPLKSQRFWRCYTSDLGRAQSTALILQSSNSDNVPVPIPDVRLRELAKGAREGLVKSVTYQQALDIFYANHNNDKNTPPPLLETEDDAWKRVYAWLLQVVRDAIRTYQLESSVVNNDDAASSLPMTFNVLVVTHSGTIRAMMNHLVKEQLPADVDVTPVGPDGSTASNYLHVPNTSVTVVDLLLRNIADQILRNDDMTQAAAASSSSSNKLPPPSTLWDAQLVQLTWTGHYGNIAAAETSSSGQPEGAAAASKKDSK